MLAAVEAHFLDAVMAALPSTVTVQAGPSLGPAGASDQLVEVSAQSLAVKLPDDEDLTAGKSPAFLSQTVVFHGDGTTTDFTLPATGVLTEVESPPGRPLQRGDEYTLELPTLKFYRPPAAGVDVVALMRGDRARGFLERRPCAIALSLFAWAPDVAGADALLGPTLAAALGATVDMPNLEASVPAGSGVRVRLLRPAASLAGVARTRETPSPGTFLRARIDLVIRGELEQSVALGAPPPEGIIQQVVRATSADPHIL
jgi:hypothetical protein